MEFPDGVNVGGRWLERKRKSVEPESARAKRNVRVFVGDLGGVVVGKIVVCF